MACRRTLEATEDRYRPPRRRGGVATVRRLMGRLFSLLGVDLDFDFRLEKAPFNRITEGLYLGGRPKTGEEEGITHIVSCLGEERRSEVERLSEDFQWLFIPLRDRMDENISSRLLEFYDFVHKAHQDRDGQAKVLVHCEAGVSRSATFVTALLMRRRLVPFFESYQALRTQRAEALPNIGFASQLQHLEFDLGIRGRDHPEPSSLARYLREICMAPVDIYTLQDVLRQHDYHAVAALQAIFDGDMPRVIQGTR